MTHLEYHSVFCSFTASTLSASVMYFFGLPGPRIIALLLMAKMSKLSDQLVKDRAMKRGGWAPSARNELSRVIMMVSGFVRIK